MVEKFNIETKKPKRILLAALDWGLGHATRCIPIIRYLIQNGCEVIIAAEGKQLSLLQLEFPTLQFVQLRGYRFKYSQNRWKTIVKIVAQIPGLFWSVYHEHQWLKRYAKQKRFDAVISDNRYGFYLVHLPSVFITHQLNIQTPFGNAAGKLVNRFNSFAIRAFDSCWVPDLAGGDNFGGSLSHPDRLPGVEVSYIGPLSRFSLPEIPQEPGLVLVLISGPEPQRTIFELAILEQAGKIISRNFVILRGLPGVDGLLITPGHVTVYNHLETAELEKVLARAEFVVSRSGYSTVMEMLSAGKKCLFIPTPGQNEQEYLATYLSGKHYCVAAKQESFSLSAMIEAAGKMKWAKPVYRNDLLATVIDNLLKTI